MEDKVKIVQAIEDTLNLTREGLASKLGYRVILNYVEDKEVVIAEIHRHGEIVDSGIINVACDSGVALIRDVMKSELWG